MKRNLYIMKDNCANCVREEVLIAHNDAVAARIVKEVLKDPNHDITKKAEDIDMYVVGSIDMESGKITAETPAGIFKLKALKEPETK